MFQQSFGCAPFFLAMSFDNVERDDNGFVDYL